MIGRLLGAKMGLSDGTSLIFYGSDATSLV